MKGTEFWENVNKLIPRIAPVLLPWENFQMMVKGGGTGVELEGLPGLKKQS